MSLGRIELRNQASELIEQAYQRGFKGGFKTGRESGNFGLVEQGRNEAWEAARKITLSIIDGGLDMEELTEIFGVNTFSHMFKNNTASEAISKIKAYEEKKQEEEICVGDEVELNEVKVIVTKTNGKYFNGAECNGRVYSGLELRLWKKTGRTFPEIAEVLKKMQEDK